MQWTRQIKRLSEGDLAELCCQLTNLLARGWIQHSTAVTLCRWCLRGNLMGRGASAMTTGASNPSLSLSWSRCSTSTPPCAALAQWFTKQDVWLLCAVFAISKCGLDGLGGDYAQGWRPRRGLHLFGA